MKALNPAHYSFSWALSVVEEAKRKHARVSDLWSEFHGLSDRQLAKLLANGREEWHVLRRCLKIFDNWLAHSRNGVPERNWLYFMTLGTPVNKCTTLERYLRDRWPHANIEEPGSKQGAGEGGYCRPTPPSLLLGSRGGCGLRGGLQGELGGPA